jgi:ElaB/YqjD/DUF883 family membrane-anchored ribosome-binding protein
MEASTQEQQGGAKQVAERTGEAASQAADQAKEKAQGLASQAQDRIRSQVDERSTQAGEQVTTTAQDIRSVGEELRTQGKEGPAKVADQAAERIERAGTYLQESDGNRILSDVEDLGRRQPWLALAAGAALGLAAARFLKASSRERYEGRIATTSYSGNGTSAQPS